MYALISKTFKLPLFFFFFFFFASPLKKKKKRKKEEVGITEHYCRSLAGSWWNKLSLILFSAVFLHLPVFFLSASLSSRLSFFYYLLLRSPRAVLGFKRLKQWQWSCRYCCTIQYVMAPGRGDHSGRPQSRFTLKPQWANTAAGNPFEEWWETATNCHSAPGPGRKSWYLPATCPQTLRE